MGSGDWCGCEHGGETRQRMGSMGAARRTGAGSRVVSVGGRGMRWTSGERLGCRRVKGTFCGIERGENAGTWWLGDKIGVTWEDRVKPANAIWSGDLILPSDAMPRTTETTGFKVRMARMMYRC
jgi:hypothetical protein